MRKLRSFHIVKRKTVSISSREHQDGIYLPTFQIAGLMLERFKSEWIWRWRVFVCPSVDKLDKNHVSGPNSTLGLRCGREQ